MTTADWAALELDLWMRVAAKLDTAHDKAVMRLVCKTLDLAASQTVSQLPARLAWNTHQPHIDKGKNYGSARMFFCWDALRPAVAMYVGLLFFYAGESQEQDGKTLLWGTIRSRATRAIQISTDRYTAYALEVLCLSSVRKSKPTHVTKGAAADYGRKLQSGRLFMCFPNLSHLTLAMLTTCPPDSLLALSKLQSLEINVQCQQGAKYLISHLNKLPSLRRLAIRDCKSTMKFFLTSEAFHQVCRCGGST